MPKRPVSVKRLQTMEKKLRGNSIADLRIVGLDGHQAELSDACKAAMAARPRR